MVAGLALVDEFAGVFDLLGRQFALASEFHSPALRGFHSGPRPFLIRVWRPPSMPAMKGCDRRWVTYHETALRVLSVA